MKDIDETCEICCFIFFINDSLLLRFSNGVIESYSYFALPVQRNANMKPVIDTLEANTESFDVFALTLHQSKDTSIHFV